MVNTLVTGRAATAGLYGCMLLYLALGMTTTQYALRASLDLMVVGEDAPFTWLRQVGLMVDSGRLNARCYFIAGQQVKVLV